MFFCRKCKQIPNKYITKLAFERRQFCIFLNIRTIQPYILQNSNLYAEFVKFYYKTRRCYITKLDLPCKYILQNSILPLGAP